MTRLKKGLFFGLAYAIYLSAVREGLSMMSDRRLCLCSVSSLISSLVSSEEELGPDPEEEFPPDPDEELGPDPEDPGPDSPEEFGPQDPLLEVWSRDEVKPVSEAEPEFSSL